MLEAAGQDPIELAHAAAIELPRLAYLERMDELVARYPDNEELRARRTLARRSLRH